MRKNSHLKKRIKKHFDQEKFLNELKSFTLEGKVEMMKDRNTKHRFLHDSIVKIYKPKELKKLGYWQFSNHLKKNLIFKP